MRSSFASLTVVRLRYPVRDDYGVEVPDYSATPTEAVIEGCWYEPTSSAESRDGRSAVRTGYTIDAPADVDVRSTDRIRIAGVEYDVEGDPLAVPSPTGMLASTRITATNWEG
ncbi:hypothetical protein [Microbacterium aurantiacum]|uniref:hypothetical protein n=1 Tax=Microbacterium aurantiacum TaxID=162393 RepID=UPI00341C92B3